MQTSTIRKILHRIYIRLHKLEPEESIIHIGRQARLDQALIDAAYHGETMKIGPLLDAGADIDVRSKSGMTPLMWAAKKGYAETCALLLEKGADIDATDNCGRTALIYTGIWGGLEACKLLVEHGADINVMDAQHNHTARMVANDIGRPSVVAYLGRMEGSYNLIGKERFSTFLLAFNECVV